jgi:hypothetical protein
MGRAGSARMRRHRTPRSRERIRRLWARLVARGWTVERLPVAHGNPALHPQIKTWRDARK